MSSIQPHYELAIGKETYKLVFTFESLSEAEELTGKTLLTGIRKEDIERPKIALIHAMFFAALRQHHSNVSFAQAKKLVTFKNMPEVWAKTLDAFVAATTSGDEAEDAPGEAQDQS
jgi:hypothetical protein